MKKIISVALRITISIVLLIFLFAQEQVEIVRIIAIVRTADIRFLLLAFAVFAGVNVLCLLRWAMLLTSINIRLPLKRIVTSFAGSLFFNLVMPSSIGGDFMRSTDLAAHTKKTKEVVATVFLDRLSGYSGLVIVACLAVVFGWRIAEDRNVFLSLLFITLVLAVILMVLFNSFFYALLNRTLSANTARKDSVMRKMTSKVKDVIKDLHNEIYLFRNKKKILAQNLLFSLAVQALMPVVFYFTALALGVRIAPLYFFIYIPIISAVTMLPISIGGLGVRENITMYLFAKAGVAKDVASTLGVLNSVFIVICAAAGGLFYVCTVHHRRVQSHQSPSVPATP